MVPLDLLDVLLILVTLALATYAVWGALRRLLPWQLAACAIALAAIDACGLL